MSWSDVGAFIPVLAGSAAAAGFLLSLVRERHPLTAAERLTTIAAQVRDGNRRALIEDHRDELVVNWVLEQRAPKLLGFWRTGMVLRTSAIMSFIAWLVAAWFAPTAVGTWVAYGAAIVLFTAGTAAFYLRRRRRTTWMEQERSWRVIPMFDDAAPVTRQG